MLVGSGLLWKTYKSVRLCILQFFWLRIIMLKDVKCQVWKMTKSNFKKKEGRDTKKKFFFLNIFILIKMIRRDVLRAGLLNSAQSTFLLLLGCAFLWTSCECWAGQSCWHEWMAFGPRCRNNWEGSPPTLPFSLSLLAHTQHGKVKNISDPFFLTKKKVNREGERS